MYTLFLLSVVISSPSQAADSDGDGFSDQLESILTSDLTPGGDDSGLFTVDNDGDNIADIWLTIKNNPDALAAYVQGTTFDTTASSSRISLWDEFIGIGASQTINLTSLTANDAASFIFIINLEEFDPAQYTDFYDLHLFKSNPAASPDPYNSFLLMSEGTGAALRQVSQPGSEWDNSSTSQGYVTNVNFTNYPAITNQTKFKMFYLAYDGYRQFNLYTNTNSLYSLNFDDFSFSGGDTLQVGLNARNANGASINTHFDNSLSGVYGFQAFNKKLTQTERNAFFNRFSITNGDTDKDGVPNKFDLVSTVSTVQNMGNPVIIDTVKDEVNPNLTLTAGSNNLTQATIEIIGSQTGDVLSIDTSSISGANNSFSGNTLTINGTGNASDYETALRTLQFTRTDSAESRLITLKISLGDSNNDQNIQTFDVSVYTPFGNLKAQLNEYNASYITNSPFNGQSKLHFIEPDDSHYQAMGFSHSAFDGYYDENHSAFWITNTLSMLRQDRDIISGYNLTEFQDYIGKDADGDKRPRYQDLGSINQGVDADNIYNLYNLYMLHPYPPATNLSSCNNDIDNCTESQLIKLSYKLNSGVEQTTFLSLPGNRSSSSRYTNWIGGKLADLSSDLVQHKFIVGDPTDTSQPIVNGSGSQNAVSALNSASLEVTELTHISEWETVRNYFVNQSETKPSYEDYNAIGYSAIDANNVDELTDRLSRLATIEPARSGGHNYPNINVVASTYNKVMSYIDDNTSDKPTELEWQDVGFEGVTSGNLTTFENLVSNIGSVDTIDALRTAINTNTASTDNDNDDVASYLDEDDNNPYTDYDGDGFNDLLEKSLAALDPLVDNSAEWTKDIDDDHIADIYNELQSPTTREPMSHWLAGQVSFQDSSITSNRIYKRGFTPNYGLATDPETVDLTFLRNSDAHYQFVAYLEHIPELRAIKLFDSKTLCQTDETCLSGADADYGSGSIDLRLEHNRFNKVQFRYSNPDTNISASLQTFSPLKNSPFNKFALVSLNWEESSKTYKLYLDGQYQGSVTYSRFESIHDQSTEIGMVGLSQNAYAEMGPAIFDNTLTGVYGFSAIASALDQTFVSTQAARFLDAVADVDNDGVWDKFDLDIDQDGVANSDELNQDKQSDPFSDTETRGVSDLLKLAITDYYDAQNQAAPSIDNTLLSDTDGDYIRDLWDHIKDDGRSRAAWAIEEWANLSTPTSVVDKIVQHHPYFIPIALLNDSSSPSPVTMDLSNIGDGDASFEIITYIEDSSLWGAVSLFGVDLELGGGQPTNTQSTGQRFMLSNGHQDKQLGFELQSKNGVSGESGANGFTRIKMDFSPSGSEVPVIRDGHVQHLALIYTQNTKSYDLYIDGVLTATISNTTNNTNNDFITAIKASNSQIGLRVESSSTGGSVNTINSPNDGIYGFAAYSGALTQQEIQQRAEAVAQRAENSDEDSAYDSLDVNTSLSVASFSQTDYTYSENQGSLTLDSSASIVDSEDTPLASLTIELIDYDANQDSINLSTINGLNINNTGDVITVTPSTGSTANRSLFEDALQTLRYENSSEDPITTTRTIRVTTNDTQRDNITDISLTVTSINDLPIANNSNVTAIEDTRYTFIANAFDYSDEESNDYSAIIIETLPSDGTLSVGSGSAITQGQVIPRADVANLQYQPQTNSAVPDSFTFHVVDDDGDNSISAATMTIDIYANNDAPSLTFDSPDKAFVNGDGPTALLKNVNITDIDSSTIASAQITLIGANSNES
ncbi:Ig-like domain-containing protein, partial [Vibrio thalassae]